MITDTIDDKKLTVMIFYIMWDFHTEKGQVTL
jgi:hypothetical protein